MAEAIPGAELAMLPGGSHLVPLERRDEVHALISNFLDLNVGI
jgi:pimeloyl-ACP methyl ester carboxylesterase